MSEQEFESYLRLLARFLHLSGNQRAAIARELRAHMEDRLEDLLARGYPREEAIQTALDEFGDAAALAGDFGRIGRRRRWIMRTTTATIGFAAAVLLVSFLMPEHRPWVPAPALSRADENAGVAPATAGAQAEPAATAAAAPPEYVSESETDADRQTAGLLRNAILPTVDLAEGTTFADAVEFLRDQAKAPMTVNWAALAMVGVEKTTDSGGLRLRDVRFETVLSILLDNVGQAAGNTGRVTYDVADGVVRISTNDDLSARTIVRIYDCRDLIGQALTSAQKKKLDALASRAARGNTRSLPPSTQPAGAGAVELPVRNAVPVETLGTLGLAPSQPGGEKPIADVLVELRAHDAQAFVDLLTSTVQPGTWAPEATIGVANEYDGLLVVRHNWTTQQQMTELLRAIRKAKAGRGTTGQALAVAP